MPNWEFNNIVPTLLALLSVWKRAQAQHPSTAHVGCGRVASHEGRRRRHSPHRLGPSTPPATPPHSPRRSGRPGGNGKGRRVAGRATQGRPTALRLLGKDIAWHRGSPARPPTRAGELTDTTIGPRRATWAGDHRHARALIPPSAFPRLPYPHPATPRCCRRRKLRERRRPHAPGVYRLSRPRPRHRAASSAPARADALPPTRLSSPTVAAAAATVATHPRSGQGGNDSGGATATFRHHHSRSAKPPPLPRARAAVAAAIAAPVCLKAAAPLQCTILAAGEYPWRRPRRPRGRHHRPSPSPPRAPTTGGSCGGCVGSAPRTQATSSIEADRSVGSTLRAAPTGLSKL